MWPVIPWSFYFEVHHHHPSAEEQSTTSFSSIDGGLEPFATADCHLTGYQDPPEDNKYTTGEQGSLSFGFPPPLSWNRYITNSLTGLLSGRRSTWPRKLNCWPESFNKGSCYCEAAHGSIWYADDSPDVQYISIAGCVKSAVMIGSISKKINACARAENSSSRKRAHFELRSGKWWKDWSPKLEVGSRKSEVRSRGSEVVGRTEIWNVRNVKWNNQVRRWKSEVGRLSSAFAITN